MALFATGRTTGMSVDVGEGLTHAVPIIEGRAIAHAARRLELAGYDVTDYLMRILTERAWYFSTSAERDLVREIKERLGYVVQDFDHEMEISRRGGLTDQEYELPDGQLLTLGEERFRAPEVLFNPQLIGKEQGIQDLVFSAISASGPENQKSLLANILPTGGTTTFEGFNPRLRKELHGLLLEGEHQKTLNIIEKNNNEKKYLSWMGAAMLSRLEAFKPNYITNAEYLEYGPIIVHKKCFDI